MREKIILECTSEPNDLVKAQERIIELAQNGYRATPPIKWLNLSGGTTLQVRMEKVKELKPKAKKEKEMTLDEAIKTTEAMAAYSGGAKYRLLAKQTSQWLTELKTLKEKLEGNSVEVFTKDQARKIISGAFLDCECGINEYDCLPEDFAKPHTIPSFLLEE